MFFKKKEVWYVYRYYLSNYLTNSDDLNSDVEIKYEIGTVRPENTVVVYTASSYAEAEEVRRRLEKM